MRVKVGKIIMWAAYWLPGRTKVRFSNKWVVRLYRAGYLTAFGRPWKKQNIGSHKDYFEWREE